MKCIKCNKESTGSFSPDTYSRGIGFCEEHKEEIQLDILIATFEGWDKFEKKYSN